MSKKTFIPSPQIIDKLKALVAEKNKALALKGQPIKKDPVVAGPKAGRNDPCHCGSGKKYKKCCMAN